MHNVLILWMCSVSTHSRPKAAAPIWRSLALICLFQHTAARRRLLAAATEKVNITFVSTHSRPKAAAARTSKTKPSQKVSTHSRPKAAALAK